MQRRWAAGGAVILGAVVLVVALVSRAPAPSTAGAVADSSSSVVPSSPSPPSSSAVGTSTVPPVPPRSATSGAPSSGVSASTSSATPGRSIAPPVPTGSPVPAGVLEVVVPIASWNPSSTAMEVSAYVSVVEQGGTCGLTATKGSLRATAQTSALPDASTTSCGDLRIPGSDLSAGTWSVVVTYRSAASSGSSAPIAVDVP
jgi:hypothetical protein